MREPELRVLDRETVRRCAAAFNPLDLVESVLREHAHGKVVLPAEAYMEWSNRAGAYCRSIAMPGGVLAGDEPIYGMKIINAAVSNPSVGLDRAGGVAIVFDAETARPSLLADAGYLSALRTSAYTMVSLRHLGPLSPESVSIIGCGALAREHLRMLARYFPEVASVYVYDTDPERIKAFLAWAERHLAGCAPVPCATAREAVAASTVLFTLTTSRQPYIERDWFRPGSFVAHTSLDDLKETVFVEAEAVFVDDVALVQDNPRRILGRLMTEGKLRAPVAHGTSTGYGPAITGTLGEVLVGRREAIRPRDGVVVSNPFGMSILDIGLLRHVAQEADAAGLVRLLPIFGEDEQ